MNNDFEQLLQVCSIILNLLGAVAFARGFFISDDEAIRLSVSRLSSKEREENIKLPAVQDRLNQRRWGIIGGILIFTASCIQIWSIFL